MVLFFIMSSHIFYFTLIRFKDVDFYSPDVEIQHPLQYVGTTIGNDPSHPDYHHQHKEHPNTQTIQRTNSGIRLREIIKIYF